MYICFLLNHLTTDSLDWKEAMQVLTGETSDISLICISFFSQKVCNMRVNASFPSSSTEDLLQLKKSVTLLVLVKAVEIL
jgi:hypothetical protein